MADKQSLYQLLGLTDKASPEDIQKAFADMRQALDTQPDSEEKHNRIAILIDARDVLLDRKQRAGYDRRQRDRRQDGRRQTDTTATGPSWRTLGLSLLLFAGLGYPAWHYITQPPSAKPAPMATVAVAPAPTSSPQPGDAASSDAAPISADIAALLPAAPTSPAPVTPTAQTATSVLPPVSQSPQGNTVMKFAESTYAVVGGAGFGTGVAIDSARVLTNCHVIAPNVHKGPLWAVSVVSGARTRITEAAFLITEDACVVHAPGLNAKPIVMGDASRLTRGTPIFNLGFAQGRLSFSAGELLGVINRRGQTYLVSSNYCDQGVSGGPLVDAEGRLVGLTSGGPRDRSFCLSLTSETARRVLDQTLIAIDGFPTDYLSNLRRHW